MARTKAQLKAAGRKAARIMKCARAAAKRKGGGKPTLKQKAACGSKTAKAKLKKRR